MWASASRPHALIIVDLQCVNLTRISRHLSCHVGIARRVLVVERSPERVAFDAFARTSYPFAAPPLFPTHSPPHCLLSSSLSPLPTAISITARDLADHLRFAEVGGGGRFPLPFPERTAAGSAELESWLGARSGRPGVDTSPPSPLNPWILTPQSAILC